MSSTRSYTSLVTRRLRADAGVWSERGWAGDLTGWRRTIRLLTHAGFRATAIFRIAHWAQMNRIRGLPTLLSVLNATLHGIEITPSIEVGGGFYIPHPIGVVITAERLGSCVEIQGSVTVGQRRQDGFPTIGNDVVVGCGARVLGPIFVGNGSIIGANAVVVRDVAPKSTMVGIPARAIEPSDTHTQSRLDTAVG